MKTKWNLQESPCTCTHASHCKHAAWSRDSSMINKPDCRNVFFSSFGTFSAENKANLHFSKIVTIFESILTIFIRWQRIYTNNVPIEQFRVIAFCNIPQMKKTKSGRQFYCTSLHCKHFFLGVQFRGILPIFVRKRNFLLSNNPGICNNPRFLSKKSCFL